MKPCAILACVAIAAAIPLTGQTVIGAGYATPGFVTVAPGQLITLYARVPAKTPSTPIVATPPLPSSLGGFAVLLRQMFPSDPASVPILAVTDSQSCSIVAPPVCDTVTLLTVQVPFELTANSPRTSFPQTTGPENFARLEITYNGNPANFLPLNPLPDSIHVLNACDIAANPTGGPPASGCLPLVARADGSLVSSSNPATPGEVLTISVVGMGITDTPVPTGAAAPQQPPSLDNVMISVDSRVNASPSMPLAGSSTPAASAQFQAGAVGVYTVTTTAPSLPSGAPACGAPVRSNATVNITRNASFDGVGICVAVSQAAETIRRRNVVE
jgi:uncharacterized protein (TIGR03437 family)